MFLLIGLFSLASPLLGLGLIAWAVWIIWRTVTLPRGGVRHPACEHCKYEVGEVSSFTCPECGRDLRETGIITPRMEIRRRGSLPGAIIGWTLLCLAVGSLGTTIMFMFSGFGAAAPATSVWRQALTPNSGAYRSLVIVFESDWQSVTDVMSIELTLNDGSVRELEVDPGPMKAAGLEAGITDWDADTVATWFGEAGLDLNDPQVAAEAREAGRAVDLIVMSPGSAFGNTYNQFTNQLTSTGGPVDLIDLEARAAILIALMFLGLILYIAGIFWICWRRKKITGSA